MSAYTGSPASPWFYSTDSVNVGASDQTVYQQVPVPDSHRPWSAPYPSAQQPYQSSAQHYAYPHYSGAPLPPTSSAPGAAHLPQYRDLWFENPSARDPRGLPQPAPHPPPEGYQPQVSHSQPPFYPPRLPQSYSTLAPADRNALRQDQPSPFVPPNIYPLERPWDQMSDYQRQVRVAQDQRDRFIHQLFEDTGDLLSERQFDRLPNFNQFSDRDAFMNFLAGDTSLVTHFKDKWGYLYQKYHLNQ